MSIWNGNYQPPLWSGTNNITSGINSNQLISTVTGLGTIGYISSSQLLSSITSIDNVLSTILSTILSTTAGGGSNNLALWANYPAITNINANGNSLINANNVNASNINTNNINGYLGNNINVNNTLIVNSNFSAKGISSLTVSTNSLTANYLSNSSNNLTIATDVTLSNHTIRNIDQIGINSIYANNGKIINIFNDTNYNNNSIYNVKSISSSVISTGILNVSSISTNFISLSSIGGTYGNYLSTTLGNLSNASTTITPSNWANYPAINDVNLSNHNMNNGNTITSSNLYATNGTTTESLYVGNGGTIFSGNAQFNKIDYGNYRNFTMDANITVANNATLSCPNFSGYYSNYFLGVNSVDTTGYFTNAATTNAQLQLYTNQSAFLLGIIPFGNAKLIANNYQITFPPIVGTTYHFRAQVGMGTTGDGANTWIKMNDDSTALLPNTSGLIEINADSVYNSIGGLLGPGRITQTAGVNQLFGTFSNQIYAGYASILQPFSFAHICAIDQYAPIGGLGGGITTIVTNGGGEEFGIKGAGARTDLVANNFLRSNDPGVTITSEMNVFCTDIIYLYTEGDTYLGWGNGSNARYGSNREQRTHLSNLFDISPTSNGVTNWYGNLDMCNNSIYNVKLNLSTGSFSTITTGHLEVFNNIYQSNARTSLPNINPYYPYINTNAIEMLNSFSSIQSYISSPYTPTRIQTITDTPHNIYASDFGYTFYSDFTTTDTVVNIQSGNGELRFYNTGTTTMHFNFYFSPSITPTILPGANLRIIVSNSNSYIADGIPLALSTIFSTVSINKTNFYQDMYDTILSVDISGYNLTSNYKQKGNFYLNASTMTFGRSNTGLEILGLPNDPPNYPIKFVLPTQFNSNVIIESLDTNSISTNSIITSNFNTNNINLDNTLYNSNSEIDYVVFPTTIYTTPSNEIIPYDMKLSISSLNTYYQYNTINLIDIYNTTLLSGLSYYELDSNCFGSAFSNEITSAYCSGLVLVATSSNFSDASTGFFDIYNGGDIPITFLTLFPNGGVVINCNASNRATFNGSTYDPPISIDAITSNNLSFFTVSSLYINDTSITQNISSTVFQIELSGYDVNNNPITLLPQFQFNNSINLSNNNIIDVAQINALSITLSDGSNITSLSNDSNNGGIAKFFTTENQFLFTTNNGNSAVIALDYSGIVETFLSNDSIGNFHLSNGYNNIIFEGTTHQDYISANCNIGIAFNNYIDLQGNNIYDASLLGVDYLQTYNNGSITFNVPAYFNSNDLSGAKSFAFLGTNPIYPSGFIGNTNDIIVQNSIDMSNNSIINLFTTATDYITANSNVTISITSPLDLNYRNIYNANNLTVDYLSNNSNRAIEVFSDFLIDGALSVVNITNGIGYVNFGNNNITDVAQIHVDFITANYNSAITSLNDLNMNYSNILNANTLTTSNISTIHISTSAIYTSSLTVSTINNTAFPLIQFGSGTNNNTITLPKHYANTNYQILLTQRGASAIIPLYSSNITTSNFYVGGSVGSYQFSWMTTGF